MTGPRARARHVLGHPGFSIGLAVIGTLLFSWPILRTPPPPASVAYPFLLLAWLGFCGLLFLAGRSARWTPDEPDADDESAA